MGRAGAAAAAVSLSRLTRVFGTQPAIVGVDLSVQRGSVVLLRGPNGAGKSTLLRVIATALTPTYGGGSVLSFDLVRERDQVRRRTELLGHHTRLYEDLTAVENLRFACALYGADVRVVAEALERVGLAEVGGERVTGFSHGMRQRLALARGLLRGPELLLLDEPYAGLDAAAKTMVDQVVLAARTAGHTVVLATHEPVREGLVTATVSMEAGRVLREPATVPEPVR
ncbi:MAG TPA: ABC transporter ATP-binding protein [Actinomycetes bacterium]